MKDLLDALMLGPRVSKLEEHSAVLIDILARLEHCLGRVATSQRDAADALLLQQQIIEGLRARIERLEKRAGP